MRADPGPAISAHRGGSEGVRAGTYEAYDRALAAGADYVEVDVRAAGDGTLIAFHRPRAGGRWLAWGRPVASLGYRELCRRAGYEVPRIAEVLALLAGRGRLHLDVKEAAAAACAAKLALGALGPSEIVATTRDPDVARLLRARYPMLPLGIAVGGDLAESARFAGQRLRHGPSAVSRLDMVQAAGATWAALHDRQAGAGLAAQCRDRGIKILVWTVNSDRAIADWLDSPDVDVLVTDRPAHALAVRNRRANPAARPDPVAPPGPPGAASEPAPGPDR